ncbi:hypothetical protein [Streptomyces sp. x-80]|uniref:hypothetical protein n=1 Tax=Streptomyces sp. x-80 TaxID=2789282 RepID=UPI00398132C3
MIRVTRAAAGPPGWPRLRRRSGRLLFALTFTIEEGRITEYDVIAAPARLRRLGLAVLG